VQNILNVTLKLTPQKFESVPEQFEFYVKGTSFNKASKRISSILETGHELTYKRETTNTFDPFAIEITHGDRRLGYVPREFSKLISVEIDMNATDYKITVLGWREHDDWDEIQVSMVKL
jgi:hypothetical protein